MSQVAAPALTLRPWLMPSCQLFTCGTCEGLLEVQPTYYGVVAVDNSRPVNGDFARFMAALHELARQDRRDVLVLEIHNPRLGPHLARTYGFTLVAGGQHAFLAVAGPGTVPAVFATARPANALDDMLNALLAPR